MAGKEDSAGGASSVVLYQSYKPPMSPSSSQPFIFQQYTVRETVTPTKLGNISTKEVSFSMCSREGDATAAALNLSFSSSTTPKKHQRSRCLPMLLQNPIPPTAHVADLPVKIIGPEEKPHGSKVRNRYSNPFKKVKVDSADDSQKQSRSRYKHCTKNSSEEQIKESKQLHPKHIFIISLVPFLVFFILVRSFLPMNNEIIEIPVSLTDSVEEEIMSSNLEALRNSLNQQVFGQQDAILSLLNILDSFINKDMLRNKQMPVILLSGSTGVGKSLISSIITNMFPAPGKAKLVFWPAPTPEVVLKKFSESHLNLVAIDSLNLSSITQAINWTKKLFSEALWQNKPVIVLMSLHVQVLNGVLPDEDDIPKCSRTKAEIFQKELESSGVDSHHIHLNVLTEENVKDCIRVALKKRGVSGPFSEEHVTTISEDINSNLEGCKSVWNRSSSVGFE